MREFPPLFAHTVDQLWLDELDPDGLPLLLHQLEDVAQGDVDGGAYAPDGSHVAVARLAERPHGNMLGVDFLSSTGDDPMSLEWPMEANGIHTSLARDASTVAVQLYHGTDHPRRCSLDVWDIAGRTRRFLWDGRTGTQLARYNWGIALPLAVAFAPDGLTLAAGGADGRVVVWDVDA